MRVCVCGRVGLCVCVFVCMCVCVYVCVVEYLDCLRAPDYMCSNWREVKGIEPLLADVN